MLSISVRKIMVYQKVRTFVYCHLSTNHNGMVVNPKQQHTKNEIICK